MTDTRTNTEDLPHHSISAEQKQIEMDKLGMLPRKPTKASNQTRPKAKARHRRRMQRRSRRRNRS